jgi:hypothetical protein
MKKLLIFCLKPEGGATSGVIASGCPLLLSETAGFLAFFLKNLLSSFLITMFYLMYFLSY